MYKSLLTSLGFSFLAFASFGQTRSVGVPQGSISTASPQQNAYTQPQGSGSVGNTPTALSSAPCIDTLLFEDFQSQSISASWQNLDLDGNADANGRPQNWFINIDEQSTIPGDTNWVAAASSWFSPAGTANNVLILDAVQPCANTILRWDSAPFEGPTFMDGYEVRISTTGTNVADFTTTLFTAAESIGATSNTSAGTVHTSFNGSNGLLETWEVSLGAYDNQTIYIAFFHDSNDDNLIQIDNIFMGVAVDYDLEVTDFSTEPYYSTPLNQVTPRTFTTDITLASGLPVTTPTATVEVYQGATNVFTDAPNVPVLNSGNTETLVTTSYTPVAIDTFTAITTASGVETDPNFANNNDTLAFVVSDSVFATCDTSFNGSLGIGSGSSGFLGNQYPVTVADDLTSITFTLSTPVVGDTVVGAIYDMIGNTPNQIVAMTDTLFVPSGATARYTLPIVGGAINLAPGNYIVGVQESTSQNVSLATNTDYYVEDLSWVFFNGAWGNNEDYGFSNTYLMEANFGPYCPDVTATYADSVSELSVFFTDASTNNDAWFWDFGDGNTSTMQNPSHTYAANGTYTVCLIATSACDADTTCTSITVSTCSNPVASYSENINTGGVVDFTSTSTTTGTATYLWDFGDGQTATSQNASNTYAANGTYTVCLTVTDSCGVDSVCTNINISGLGIEENSLIDQLSIFPIPAQETITISNLLAEENFTLELLNNLGQVVSTIQTNGLETVQFDVSSIVEGYYHLRISNQSMNGTRAVLIKH